MAALVFVNPLVVAEPKRSRRSHAKVKTGCLTCKIRHKKCDETRPACQRCTSTGRKCDGYDTITPPHPSAALAHLRTPPNPNSASPPFSNALLPTAILNQPNSVVGGLGSILRPAESKVILATEAAVFEKEEDRSSTALVQSPNIARNPSTAVFHTERENFAFQFFRERTGPEFSGYFDSAFWSGFLLQTCYHHPAIQHAVVALGAVHRRFELGITPEAFSYCDFAAKAYADAIYELRKSLASRETFALQITLIASALFCAFETFQGNNKQAYQHMIAGLKVLFDRQFQLISTSSTRNTAHLSEKTLYQLFDRLEILGLEFFGSPARLLTSPHGGIDRQLPEVPKRFNTLEQARDVLYTQVQWIFHTVQQSRTDQSGLLSRQQDHVVRLLQWSCSYAEFDKASATRISVRNVRAVGLLRVYREAACLLLLLQSSRFSSIEHILGAGNDVSSRSEFDSPTHKLRADALGTHFAKIVNFTDTLSVLPVAGHSHPSFSVDSGISPPLYLAATKCRSTKLRHQASSLLSKTPARKQILDSFGAYVVAEKISAMEEGALEDCGAVPSGVKTRCMDISVFLEERRVLMRYCTQDDADGSLVWTQDWVAF